MTPNYLTVGLARALGYGVTLFSTTSETSPWLQFGLGGLALLLLYTVLKPLVKSQTDSNRHVVAAMDRLAEAQATSVETQRVILLHAQNASKADAELAKAVALLYQRMERHLTEDEARERRLEARLAQHQPHSSG